LTTATLTATPATGPANTLVNLTGAGYAPSTVYTICLQATATPCAAGPTFTSTAASAIPPATSFTIPMATAAGAYFIDISQGASNYIDSASFTVTTATLVLTPSVGPVGTNITLSGGGYSPGLVYYYCFSLTNGGACLSLNKTFTASVGGTIP